MTPTVPESPDRFEPSPQQREKQGKSASKRIALFIFVGAGIIFTLVAMSILNSGDGLKSGNTPVNLFEASRGAESITLPKPKPPEPRNRSQNRSLRLYRNGFSPCTSPFRLFPLDASRLRSSA